MIEFWLKCKLHSLIILALYVYFHLIEIFKTFYLILLKIAIKKNIFLTPKKKKKKKFMWDLLIHLIISGKFLMEKDERSKLNKFEI